MKIITPTWPRFERIGAKAQSDPKFATMQARDAEAQRTTQLVEQTKLSFARVLRYTPNAWGSLITVFSSILSLT